MEGTIGNSSDTLLTRAEDAHQAAIANPRRGRRIAESVAAEARAARNAEALVVSLRAAGWAARELYDHHGARRLMDEAVRVARHNELARRLAEALLTRSTIHLEEGRIGPARRDLAAARRGAPAPVRAEVLFTAGLVEEIAGDFGAAAAAYDESLALVDPALAHLRTKALVNRALVALRLGEYGLAERHLDAAFELAESFSPAVAAIVAHNQAMAAAEDGRSVVALHRFDRAEAMLRRAEVPLVEHFLEKAGALLTIRMLAEAAAATERAIAELQTPGSVLLLGEALMLDARIALQRHRYPRAAESAVAAAAMFRRQRRPGWRATAELLLVAARLAQGEPHEAVARWLSGIRGTLVRVGDVSGTVSASLLEGRVLRAAGQKRRALAAFRRAEAGARRGPVLLRLQGRLAGALAAEVTGDAAALGRIARRGLADLEQYRSTLASAELRARAAAHGVELANLGLRAAVATQRPHRAWSWLERTRAVALAPPPAVAPDGRLAPLLAELRSLHGRLDAVTPASPRERDDLLRRVARLEGRIRTLTWQRGADDEPETTGPSAVAADLPRIGIAPTRRSLDLIRQSLDGRAILEFGAVDGDMFAVVVTADRLRFLHLGASDEVDAATRLLGTAMRRLTRPGSAPALRAAMANTKRALARLDELLVKPMAGITTDAREVVVVPPGDLFGVPWGALAGLRRQPVRVAPSAAAWFETATRRATSRRVVAIAGPDLVGAEPEATAVAAVHPRSRLLRPEAATCDTVLRAVVGARLVHLACHGRLRADSPTFSSFQMADGPLTVHDLERLVTPAHHWILAACDLGNPGRLAGPDLEGVLAALLASGAGAVVAAVVPIPDTDTTPMMTALHERLRAGDSPAQALRTATGSIDDTEPLGLVATTAFGCYGGG